MQYELHDCGHGTLATLDIETTGVDPAEGEVVAVGVGRHVRGAPSADAAYRLFVRESADDEAATVTAAVDALNGFGADALVTYNGVAFDLPFLDDRLALLGVDPPVVDLAERDAHVDLFVPRQVRADGRDESWPALEDCLESYGLEPAVTLWGGREVCGGLFADELGPDYLRAVADGATGASDALRDAVEHYLVTDLEANLALYHRDVGLPFDPQYDGDCGVFAPG